MNFQTTVALLGYVIAVVCVGFCIWRLREEARLSLPQLVKLRAENKVLQRAIAEAQKANDDAQAGMAAMKLRSAPYLRIADLAAELQLLQSDAQERAAAIERNANKQAIKIQEDAVNVAERLKHDSHQLVETAKSHAETIRLEAVSLASKANAAAQDFLQKTQLNAAGILEQANLTRRNADNEAQAKAEAFIERERGRVAVQVQQVLADAHRQAGEALSWVGREQELKRVVIALQNRVDGYGDKYLEPVALLMDELAEHYGKEEAASQLKAARQHVKSLLNRGQAGECDYTEPERRRCAIAFVVDAFNGKVDAALAGLEVGKSGQIRQAIRDAAVMVAQLGKAFRNARILPDYVDGRLAELDAAVVFMTLRQQEREEQREIRERMREEERAKRDYERALKEAQKDEDRSAKALQEAMRLLEKSTETDRARYAEQVRELEVKLAEAHAKGQRALSMAQQTRAGHCYVISNHGAFGEDVVKIGMTRRLDPMDRVRELGDASVPFPFDVHAIVYSDDAPALENELHRKFNLTRMNLVNPRKEFFRASLKDIRLHLESKGIEAEFTMTAQAIEWRQSQQIALSPERRQAVLDVLLLEEEAFTFDQEEEMAP